MLKVFAVCFTFLMIPATATFAQSWTTRRLADMPAPVTNNAVSWGFNPNGDSCLYSFGGIDSSLVWSGITCKAYRYNIRTDVWDTIAPLPDTLGKIASSASKIGDTIYIIGGYHVFQNSNELSSNRVHRYVTTTDSYLPDGAPVPFPIDDHVQCVWRDSLIYVISGWSNTGNTNRVQVYNPYTNSWQQATPVPSNYQYEVFGASGIFFNDTIYYQGGASMAADFPATSLIRKGVLDHQNPFNINWSLPFSQMYVNSYRAACLLDDFNWINWVGGSEISYNYDGIAYDGSGAVPVTGETRLYIPWQPLPGSASASDSLPMDLRGIVHATAGNGGYTRYIIAGGMWSGSHVSNETLLLEWDWLGTVSENSSPGFVRLYPNPSSGIVSFRFNENISEPCTFQVLDIAGRMLYENQFASSTGSIDLSSFADGIYTVCINSTNSSYTSRIIIAH